jgi:hypothetical protein
LVVTNNAFDFRTESARKRFLAAVRGAAWNLNSY